MGSSVGKDDNRFLGSSRCCCWRERKWSRKRKPLLDICRKKTGKLQLGYLRIWNSLYNWDSASRTRWAATRPRRPATNTRIDPCFDWIENGQRRLNKAQHKGMRPVPISVRPPIRPATNLWKRKKVAEIKSNLLIDGPHHTHTHTHTNRIRNQTVVVADGRERQEASTGDNHLTTTSASS